MRNSKRTILTVVGSLAPILVATSAQAHPGDHDSNLSGVAPHMLTSPLHQIGWLFAATLTIGLVLAVAKVRSLDC